jgi:glycosyltransferase involved in cell wall biosynthesis
LNLVDKRVIVFKTELLRDSEVFIREQARAYGRWKPVLAGFQRLGGVDLTGLDVEILAKKLSPKWISRLRRVLRELDLSPPATVSRLKRWNPSLLHIHFGNELVALWPAARALGVPVVTTLHGMDVNIDDEWWSKGSRADRLYPRRLTRIGQDARVYFVAVSEAIRNRAIQRGIPAERIFVRHIGVDVCRFTPGGLPILKRRRRVLHVGRMVEKKGGSILIEAFARVVQRVADAELVMVGAGPLLAEFQERAQALQLPIAFRGSLDSTKVKQEMDEARVFCLPSITARNGDAEGFGLVLLEAQACGVPAVSSARGGAKEGIRDGVTGFIFPEGDVVALEATLFRLLTDDALATSMSGQARRFVEANFDIRTCTADLEDLYDQIYAATADL